MTKSPRLVFISCACSCAVFLAFPRLNQLQRVWLRRSIQFDRTPPKNFFDVEKLRLKVGTLLFRLSSSIRAWRRIRIRRAFAFEKAHRLGAAFAAAECHLHEPHRQRFSRSGRHRNQAAGTRDDWTR
jgi:hypothetical protein